MKFEPENKDFDYNQYMHELGGFGWQEEYDIWNLENEDNIYKKLKGYIAIFRRHTRISHHENSGNWDDTFSNEFVEKSFSNFKELIHENTDEIFKNLSSRWILSILNCFYDVGSDEEKSSALAISTLGEIHRYTVMFLYTIPDIDDILENKLVRSNPILSNGDDYICLFKRIRHSITKDTKPLVEGLIKRYFDEDKFIFNLFNQFEFNDMKKDILKLLEKDSSGSYLYSETVKTDYLNTEEPEYK